MRASHKSVEEAFDGRARFSQVLEVGATTSAKVNLKVQAGSNLAYPDNTLDRLAATHVLEHIYQPHLKLNEWRRVVELGGILSILIPTDSCMAWSLGRHFGPRKNAIAKGIAYDYVMAREHVNSCSNLIAILCHCFPGSKEARWPFPVSSVDLNLVFAFHAMLDKRKEGQ